ncbi:2-hydroxy-3-keto-5-methylthiopentenyl-1-phosphate phosphatase [Bacillus salacetis]|uniref:2-hydroxy-3-keto-5-methylthiopentenyl-1-phosphate phosphatase n=1 Tax=Bacillus salacetis TaxID=2315464 RepID=A0A3A1R510_9BACI|nr:2-hydroxy-3-keto-5-methylthiopentenyl-1-phosphate phosphatase [Bacillus salacetis]RIW38286.1 2-hydroxy-3-keto-5-methylthiopentenyl-1-phosphate phosphatase [Bacillus salacetis]
MTRMKIFCDFDGTITTTDNIISLMKKFAPPEWNAIKDSILNQRVSIKKGVSEMFLLLPASLRDELVQYLLDTHQLRPGFNDFIEWTRQQNIDLKIVSGGIDFFVEPILEGLLPRNQVYCNSADFTGDTIKITWPHPCDEFCDNECGCCKTSIIRQEAQPEDFIVMIGDSITDLEGAKLADLVFACDEYLADKCRELGLNYRYFDTFHEVIEGLQEINRKAGTYGQLS